MPMSTIEQAFKDFGYTPTKAELDIFDQIQRAAGPKNFGRTYSPGAARSAVGAYVEAYKQIEKRKAEDPLNPYVAQEKARGDEMTRLSQEAYDKLTQLYQQAPQLFGSMNEQQISQYLAPLQDQFNRSLAQVEGAFSRRGLVGSNIEASAMGEQGRLFNQNVLNTGLQVGLQQQQNLGNAYQNRSTAMLQGADAAYGRQGQALGQLSSISAQEAQMLASLPSYLQNQALQQLMLSRQMNPQKQKGNVFGGALSGALSGGITGFMMGGPMGAAAGAVGGGVLGGVNASQSDQYAASQNQQLMQQLPFYLQMARGGGGTSSSSDGIGGTYNGSYNQYAERYGLNPNQYAPPRLSPQTAGVNGYGYYGRG